MALYMKRIELRMRQRVEILEECLRKILSEK